MRGALGDQRAPATEYPTTDRPGPGPAWIHPDIPHPSPTGPAGDDSGNRLPSSLAAEANAEWAGLVKMNGNI